MPACLFAARSLQAATSAFHEGARRWTLSNDVFEAAFELTNDGRFLLVQLRDTVRNTEWAAGSTGSSPIRFRAGDKWWDVNTRYNLQAHSTRDLGSKRSRTTIVLEEASGAGTVTLELEIADGVPVLRHAVRFRNMAGQPTVITGADLAPWDFDDGRQTFAALRVEQWFPDPAAPADFKVLFDKVDPAGQPVTAKSGSEGRHCAWIAVQGSADARIVVGIEFDGRADTSVRHLASSRRLQVESVIAGGMYQNLEHGEEAQLPGSFLGLFSGDFDNAGWVAQRFLDVAISRPIPPGTDFPYVTWDSWAYGTAIQEDTLRRNADLAAQLGIEMFIVDLGWARRIGDWREDPAKFPSGLRALSDYVHRLGMKFGLHLAWAEVDPQAPVLAENPDWTNTTRYGYYGSDSLCLAHRPAREWIIDEIVRVIDDYNVDWILQDGEGMVKECQKSSHTHHGANSNFAGADALDIVLGEVQKRRPRVLWENCENGGGMMTYNMAANYATSIVNDASGALGSRRGVYGVTFPFPARYTDRYMPEETLSPYVTRSYMFGGPWIFMNRLERMSPADLSFAAREITLYKKMRRLIQGAKILHLAPPAQGEIDAIAAWQPASDSAIAVVTRDGSPRSTFPVVIGDLSPARSYRVSFADDTRVLTLTGSQIGTEGVSVRLAEPRSSEVVFIDPLI